MGERRRKRPPARVLGHDRWGNPVVGVTDQVMELWSRVRDGRQDPEENPAMATSTYKAVTRERIEELRRTKDAIENEIGALEDYLERTGDDDPLVGGVAKGVARRGGTRAGSIADRVKKMLEEDAHGTMEIDSIIRLLNGAGLKTHSRYFKRNLKHTLRKRDRVFVVDGDEVSLVDGA